MRLKVVANSPLALDNAMVNGKKIPVRQHSAKLPEKCIKWSPCDLEALALVAGINKEYTIIRESKHPLITQTDSKPVHEAIKLINNGKFSTTSRMSSFLTNCNRTQIESRHISGKAKLNPLSDIQITTSMSSLLGLRVLLYPQVHR